MAVASDPVDPARVYLATGLYTRPGSAGAAVLFSDRRGDTGSWTAVPLAGVTLGGNEDGRNAGERLAVDGNDNRRVYLGTSHNGFYRSVDRGVTWARVAAWPGAQSLTWVAVDDTTATSTLYAAAASGSPAIYASTNGGDAWTAVPGQPSGLIPIRVALDRRTRAFYLTFADHLGPNGMTSGAVHRFDVAAGTWRDVTPPASVSPRGGGFAGVAVDALTSAVMVTTMDRWCARGGMGGGRRAVALVVCLAARACGVTKQLRTESYPSPPTLRLAPASSRAGARPTASCGRRTRARRG